MQQQPRPRVPLPFDDAEHFPLIVTSVHETIIAHGAEKSYQILSGRYSVASRTNYHQAIDSPGVFL